VDPDLVWGAPVHRRRVVIPVFDVRWDVIQAVRFGRSMSDDITAVYVTDDVATGEQVRERFERQLPGIQFVIVESPYRNLVDPLIRYLEVAAERDSSSVTVVLLPERMTHHWWEHILFNQNIHRIRDALTGRPDTSSRTFRSGRPSAGARTWAPERGLHREVALVRALVRIEASRWHSARRSW